MKNRMQKERNLISNKFSIEILKRSPKEVFKTL